MLKIGDFSKLAMTSIRMLRYYDEHGLLVPAFIDQATGYRYYHARQLNDVANIRLLQQLGLSLAEIKLLQKANYQKEAMLQSLQSSYRKKQGELQNLQAQIAALEDHIAKLERNEFMSQYHVELKTVPRRLTAALTKTLERYEDEHELWQEINALCTQDQVKISHDFPPVTVYLDTEYHETRPTVQAQVCVAESFTPTSPLQLLEMPATEVISVVFNGSYEQINGIYAQMAEWLETHDYDFNGNMFLVYLTSPDNTPMENWVSELCIPVRAHNK